jgi:hypothetical protein
VLRERVATHADPQLAISLAAKERTRTVLTAPEVRSAARTVAARLGTDEIGPEDYERTRGRSTQNSRAATSTAHT